MKKDNFKIQEVCFFRSDELENYCLVVEKYACAPKMFGIIFTPCGKLYNYF